MKIKALTMALTGLMMLSCQQEEFTVPETYTSTAEGIRLVEIIDGSHVVETQANTRSNTEKELALQFPSENSYQAFLENLKNKTHKEIAKLLGISTQTSGSQLFHARAMLREIIVKHKLEKGMVILAIIIIAMIFQHNQNDHRVETISEPTKLRTEKNNDIENKVEQNEKSIKQIELQSSKNTALLSEICVEKEDSFNLSTKAENLLAETKTDNGEDADTAKHDICSNPNKMEFSARAHHSNDLPITKRKNRNFSVSVGGSVIGALNTENSYLKPSDNPIWECSNYKVI